MNRARCVGLVAVGRGLLSRTALAAVFLLASACASSPPAPTSSPSTGSPVRSASGSFAASDATFRGLFLAIEEQRAEVFTDLVALDSDPPRDLLWRALNSFLGEADQIEYSVQVDRRNRDGQAVVYVFSWQRKHQVKETGQILTTRGQSEWRLVKGRGEEYFLKTIQGSPIF